MASKPTKWRQSNHDLVFEFFMNQAFQKIGYLLSTCRLQLKGLENIWQNFDTAPICTALLNMYC